jgi:HD-GYP domain-containing protein (c-di-GMP phosphodiesterase class II)
MAQLTTTLNLRIAPEEMEVWDVHRDPPTPWPDDDELTTFREGLVDQLRDTYRQLDSGSPVDVGHFAAIVDELWRKLIDHRERFTQLALMVPRRDDYLADHAMCVAVLAMATGAQLTWSQDDVRLAGLAGLVCDIGMMMVPARIRSGGEQLTDIDRGRVQRHAAYSVVMCDAINGLSDAVKLAAYQHHERENGSGYPANMREGNIHDLARVVAVADVFAALTSPRHYRQNKLPYTAMEQMIRFAAASQFDKPTTRALVQSAGLFPVGSFVKLSTDQLAQIIAANPNHLDRPIIRPLDDSGKLAETPIDLAGVPAEQIKVERPIEPPAAAA